MRLTVIFCDLGDAIHVGGPPTYRRVTVDLTPEQAARLAPAHGYEKAGTVLLEETAPPPAPACEPCAAPVPESGDAPDTLREEPTDATKETNR